MLYAHRRGEPVSVVDIATSYGRGAKRPGREVDRSSLSIAEVKMSGAIPLRPVYAFMACTGTPLPLLRWADIAVLIRAPQGCERAKRRTVHRVPSVCTRDRSGKAMILDHSRVALHSRLLLRHVESGG